MRVLHLNNEKTWRGGERQTLLLAASLRERGLASIIGCRPGAPLDERAASQSVATLPIAGNTVGAVLALLRAARDFDLIHCHTGRGHSLAAITQPFHRKPLLVTRRVDFLPRSSWFNHYKFRQASRVVCISRFIADQLAGWGVPRERLAVIRSTVPLPDANWLSPEHRETVRARLGIPADMKLVGNIAALVGHKDQATLLRAAKLVVGRRKHVRFVIIGEGELKEPLHRLRRELQLEEQVVMPGFIPHAERYLPAFDVYCMSSCMEGLGSIVLDAFAAGVPVVATAAGGLPELVRDGDTGLLVPVGDVGRLSDAIERILEDGMLAGRTVPAAGEWVRQHCSVETMANRYEKLYRELLRSSVRPKL